MFVMVSDPGRALLISGGIIVIVGTVVGVRDRCDLVPTSPAVVRKRSVVVWKSLESR